MRQKKRAYPAGFSAGVAAFVVSGNSLIVCGMLSHICLIICRTLLSRICLIIFRTHSRWLLCSPDSDLLILLHSAAGLPDNFARGIKVNAGGATGLFQKIPPRRPMGECPGRGGERPLIRPNSENFEGRRDAREKGGEFPGHSKARRGAIFAPCHYRPPARCQRARQSFSELQHSPLQQGGGGGAKKRFSAPKSRRKW